MIMTINKKRVAQAAPLIMSMLLMACGWENGSVHSSSGTDSLENTVLNDLQNSQTQHGLDVETLAESIDRDVNSSYSLDDMKESSQEVLLHQTINKSAVELPGVGLFIKPLTQAQADQLGVAYSTTKWEMGEAWPRYTQSQAVAMCNKLGSRLATKEELSALYHAYPDKMLKDVLDWPTLVGYWSNTNNAGPYYYYYVYLDDHYTSSNNPTNNHYASCVTFS
ncbi:MULTISPECIES: adhesion domain-containing protein [Vibrio]|uniref:adhesion domain-containing protein n=1 Tax=Vibrio TaxID=662 RepID=UPI0005F0A1F1|nr:MULTISPECIES: DUF823 domain-containing adhesin [Vibrio]KJR30105.1 hypothetical protein UF06_09690 [Vibrio sp. S234-5]MBE3653317.1 hypothetical protein [Vibrio navarrensis]MBE4605658.1 hypothetical protein [Vibrio navarrensis]